MFPHHSITVAAALILTVPCWSISHVDAPRMVCLIEPRLTQERMIKRATDKSRQAGRGMPAVLIRQMENFEKIMSATSTTGLREFILRQAAMILEAREQSVPDDSDRRDVQAAYDALAGVSREVWHG